MSTVDTTISEMASTLNGFDELAIKKEFRQSYYTLADDETGDRGLLLRTLVFVHLRREGAKDPAAYRQAMELTQLELGEYFADEPEGEGGDDLPEGLRSA